MSAYLVRLEKNKEFAGLFVVPTFDHLWWAVDECCDPYACEFIHINYGGIMWPTKNTPAYDEDGNLVNLDGAHFTSTLDNVFIKSNGWKPLDEHAPFKSKQ